MWTGNVSPVIRQKAKGTRPKRNLERRAARRVVLAGYPVPPRQFSLEEVRAYYSGDKITCLRCGKSYRRLGVHLRYVHAMDGAEYRSLYGLPWVRGLSSQSAHDVAREIAIHRLAEGTLGSGNPDMGSMRGAAKSPRHAFHRELARHNVAPAERPDGYPLASTIRRFIEKVGQGVTPREAYGKDGLPGRSWFTGRMKAAHKAVLLGVIHAQPYEFQARAQFGFSERFYRDVRRMRKIGMSDSQIGAELGVSAMTINRNRRRRGIA